MQPWERLTAATAVFLRPTLPEVVDDTVSAIAREVPVYSDTLGSDTGPTVRRGTDVALNRLLDLFGTDGPALDARAERLYRRIGAMESEQGRSMEALLSAYRIGARVAWEHMSASAVAGRIPTEQLVGLE